MGERGRGKERGGGEIEINNSLNEIRHHYKLYC